MLQVVDSFTMHSSVSVRVACSLARMTEWWPMAGSVQWPCTCLSRSTDPRGRLLSHRPLCPSVLACDVIYCSTMRRNYIAVTVHNCYYVWAQLDEWWADWQDVRGDLARSLLQSKGLNNSQSRWLNERWLNSTRINYFLAVHRTVLLIHVRVYFSSEVENIRVSDRQ